MLFSDNSWLFRTVLPWRVNWPILREFIAPLCPLGMEVARIEFHLSGIPLTEELLDCWHGFYARVFHYVPDQLCSWQPTDQLIARLPCLCTIVNNDIPELHGHFGKSEHSYGHWLDIPMHEGWFSLWQFLQTFPEAADPKMRDVTPLRLMSWLSCQLSDRTHLLIQESMAEFSQVEPVHSDKILQIGQFHLPDTARNLQTWDNMRDAVIDEITVKGRAQPPVVVVNLIQGFLRRLPLPRLLHFVDLALPQMAPVCSCKLGAQQVCNSLCANSL